MLRDGPQRPGQNPVEVLIPADREDVLGLGPLPLENRAFAREMRLGLERRFEQEKVDDLLDEPGLPAETEIRMAERCQVFQAFESGLFLDFAQRRLDQGLAALLVPFRESPTPERILDEEDLDAMPAAPEDDAARRNLVADAAGMRVIQRWTSAFWLTRPASEPVFR